MKSILERFMKAPYGFVEADIWWLIAKLFKDGEIALFVNNEPVTLLSKSENEIIRYITRKEYNEKLMIEKRVKANDRQKKSVRDVMKELFNVTSSSDDDDAIMKSFLGYAQNLKNELEKLEIHYEQEAAYPGKDIVRNGKNLIIEVLQMKYSTEFFNGIDSKKDDYLDFAEDYEPLKKFFAGDQKGIFDKALRLMKIYDDSKTFIVDNEIEAVVSDIKFILKKPSPYSDIFKLPDLLQKFTKLYYELLKGMQTPVEAAINDAKSRVFAELEGKKCHDKLSDKYVRLFNELKDKLDRCNNVATLQNIKMEADALKVRCLIEISEEEAKYIVATKPDAPSGDGDMEASANNTASVPIKKQKTISIKSVNTSTTWQLENEDNVRKYISELEGKLIQLLEKDTIINIEF